MDSGKNYWESSRDELVSIRKSYLNILTHFLSSSSVESKYVVCILKWGVQLNLTKEDIKYIEKNMEALRFAIPTGKVEKMEAVYHLVRMIYLDQIVEDVELEVATLYAEKLGFKPYIVGDLFKAIATAPFDEKSNSKVEDEVKEFLELNGID